VRFFFADGLSSAVAWFNHGRRSDAAPLVLALNPHTETAEIRCDGLPFERYRQIADHDPRLAQVVERGVHQPLAARVERRDVVIGVHRVPEA